MSHLYSAPNGTAASELCLSLPRLSVANGVRPRVQKMKPLPPDGNNHDDNGESKDDKQVA